MPTRSYFSRSKERILILGANYDTGNMGVDALLSGSLASILNARPNAEIIVLDFSHEPRNYEVPFEDRSVEVRLENIRFSWKIWLRNNAFRLLVIAFLTRFFPFSGLRRRAIASHPVLQTIEGTSIALSLAGGDSFSDIYGFRRLLYVCLPQFLILEMQRPLALLPQTLGPFDARWAKAMGKSIMARAQRVYARDRESLEFADWLLGSKANRLASSADMAFALEPCPPEGGLPDWVSIRKRPLVGLNVSGLLFIGGYSGDNMFHLKSDYPALMREIIRLLTTKLDCDVALVSHVGGLESDAKSCSSLFESMQPECNGQLHNVIPDYNHREIKSLIGKCDFFLGARMHATIAALSQGIPAIGLAYSRKFAGVFESVGVQDLVIDLRSQSQDEILERVEVLFNNREIYRAKLSEEAVRAHNEVLNLSGELLQSAYSSNLCSDSEASSQYSVDNLTESCPSSKESSTPK